MKIQIEFKCGFFDSEADMHEYVKCAIRTESILRYQDESGLEASTFINSHEIGQLQRRSNEKAVKDARNKRLQRL